MSLTNLRRRACFVEKCRIEKITAVLCIPGQPGVGFGAKRGAFADYEPHVCGAMGTHFLIKSDRLGLAVSRGTRFGFGRCLPKSGITVWDGTELSHPLIDGGQGNIVAFVSGRSENRANAGHLAVVGGTGDSEEKRIGKGSS